MTKSGAYDRMKKPRKGRALLHNRRLATSLRREVMQMGNGRWMKVLRIVVYLIIGLVLMVCIAPKAC